MSLHEHPLTWVDCEEFFKDEDRWYCDLCPASNPENLWHCYTCGKKPGTSKAATHPDHPLLPSTLRLAALQHISQIRGTHSQWQTTPAAFAYLQCTLFALPSANGSSHSVSAFLANLLPSRTPLPQTHSSFCSAFVRCKIPLAPATHHSGAWDCGWGRVGWCGLSLQPVHGSLITPNMNLYCASLGLCCLPC